MNTEPHATLPPGGGTPASVARRAASVGLALLGFVVTTALVRPLVPLPQDDSLGPKLAHYRAAAERYDVVFLGSSRVFRHVVPEVFDARLAELGRPLRSFNLGTSGAGPFETDHLLREILAAGSERLRYVFIEAGDWRGEVDPANRTSARVVRWHTFHGTRTAVASALESNDPLGERLARAADHVAIFGAWFANVGQGLRLARGLAGNAPTPPMSAEEVELHAGYQALEDAPGEGVEQRKLARSADPTTLRGRIDRLPRENARRVATSEATRRGVTEQGELARAAGIEIVYLLPPGTTPSPGPLRMHERGELPALLAFNDPAAFPGLYRLESFFDNNHLDRDGARRFSTLLADAFAKLGSPPPKNRPGR